MKIQLAEGVAAMNCFDTTLCGCSIIEAIISHGFITCKVGAWKRYQQITCYGKLLFQQKDDEAMSLAVTLAFCIHIPRQTVQNVMFVDGL
jgi:hypothetical protein